MSPTQTPRNSHARPVRIGRAVLLGSVLAGLAATPAPAASLREHVITTRPLTNGEPRLSQLDAGHGYVAWLERTPQGVRQQAVLRDRSTTRRSAWLRGDIAISLERQADLRTGRLATRLEVRRTRTGNQSRQLLSPTTMRPTVTRWAPRPNRADPVKVSVDGARTATLTDAPEAVPTPRTSDWQFSTPTECHIEITGAAAPAFPVPVLPDCNSQAPSVLGGVTLRGSLLAVSHQVPSSSGNGSSRSETYMSAVSLMNLDDPAPAWRRLATGVSSYDGLGGLQDFCMLDRGVVLLEGTQLDGSTSSSDWTLRYVPADQGEAGWTAAMPSFEVYEQWLRFGGLACGSRSIYAAYAKRSSGRTIQQIVRLDVRD